MLLKIIPPVDYNSRLKRFDTQLNEPTNQNSIKVSEVFKSNNKQFNKQPNVSYHPASVCIFLFCSSLHFNIDKGLCFVLNILLKLAHKKNL